MIKERGIGLIKCKVLPLFFYILMLAVVTMSALAQDLAFDSSEESHYQDTGQQSSEASETSSRSFEQQSSSVITTVSKPAEELPNEEADTETGDDPDTGAEHSSSSQTCQPTGKSTERTGSGTIDDPNVQNFVMGDYLVSTESWTDAGDQIMNAGGGQLVQAIGGLWGSATIEYKWDYDICSYTHFAESSEERIEAKETAVPAGFVVNKFVATVFEWDGPDQYNGAYIITEGVERRFIDGKVSREFSYFQYGLASIGSAVNASALRYGWEKVYYYNALNRLLRCERRTWDGDHPHYYQVDPHSCPGEPLA